jgi:rhodanese-related sulfurtransferase
MSAILAASRIGPDPRAPGAATHAERARIAEPMPPDHAADHAAQAIPTVSVTEAAARLRDGSGAVLVDVREHHEVVALRVPGAVLLPMGEIPARLGELPTDRALMLICRSGARSGRVTAFLLSQGFAHVANVAGGMIAWHDAGLETRSGPIVPAEGERIGPGEDAPPTAA